MSDRWEPVARADRARLEQADRNARNVLEMNAARARIVDLEATVERVRALHHPCTVGDLGQCCDMCSNDEGTWQTWPCPTIAALDPPEADHA